jgi:hypothetical protein
MKVLSGENVVWSGKPTVLAFYDALVGGALLVAISIVLLATPLSAIAWLSALGVVCGAILFSKCRPSKFCGVIAK